MMIRPTASEGTDGPDPSPPCALPPLRGGLPTGSCERRGQYQEAQLVQQVLTQLRAEEETRHLMALARPAS